MLTSGDAELIICDPAMKIPRDQFRVFDLATLWHEFTGFGFVFAMWMVETHSAEKVCAIDFVAARDEGLAHVDHIAIENEVKLGLSRDEIKTYLTKNIAFRMN